MQSYGVPKLRESQLWEEMGILGQNVIWMGTSWKDTKYTIKGKVVVSPSPGRAESYEFEFIRDSS